MTNMPNTPPHGAPKSAPPDSTHGPTVPMHGPVKNKDLETMDHNSQSGWSSGNGNGDGESGSY